ncbi:MAG: hypothetical protein KKD73_12930 [Proteobacteria bacterium]|nr:hypothetical protein [Pseudomonadota bacterium]MBU1641706.1 hypothetical protein [Pseudomonadota bacterium]
MGWLVILVEEKMVAEPCLGNGARGHLILAWAAQKGMGVPVSFLGWFLILRARFQWGGFVAVI